MTCTFFFFKRTFFIHRINSINIITLCAIWKDIRQYSIFDIKFNDTDFYKNDQELHPFTSEQNFRDPPQKSRINSLYFWTKFSRSSLWCLHWHGAPPPFPFPNPLTRESNSTQILPPGPSGSPLSSQILRVSSSVRLKMRRQKPIFKKND